MNSQMETTMIINWLIEGDPSIRWQTLRDLCNVNEKIYSRERQKVASEGWGAKLLSYQEPNGMWGGALYHHKWISTTYTMLVLKSLGLPKSNSQAKKACKILLEEGIYHDGGINYFGSLNHSETCVTGMILSILAYFEYEDNKIKRLTDFLLNQQLNDGGWNCQSFKGSKHGSFHTTISVLEGLREYEKLSPLNRKEIIESQEHGREFLLVHRLFKSHRTTRIFDPRMTRFSFPPRWRYDVLRALDYFQESDASYDERIEDAIGILLKRKTSDGKWKLQNRHPGRTFFEMEKVGLPSRWNTLRAMRVLKLYDRVKNEQGNSIL